ncbi:acyltransferase family protein [Archangium lipolyticum]|uniref:acyltransferase family protein n=1 Tax=Archangium lipolyticum TaxID=2970465 RepID=UPI00214A1264|nr:acyltransferase [Archangium lipolyticum]
MSSPLPIPLLEAPRPVDAEPSSVRLASNSPREVGSIARRMTLVDGLRGFAALAVVLPHAVGLFIFAGSGALSEWMVRVADFGHRGVEVFFALSGFVIAFSLRHTRLSPRGIGQFILRRSLRLDPPYWVALGLFCGYLLLRAAMTGKPAELPSAPHLLSHLLYLQDVLGYGQLNIAFWTLCIEFQFYLAFAVLLGCAQALSRWSGRDGVLTMFFSVLFVVSLAWPMGLVEMRSHQPHMMYLPSHVFIFLAGALTWWTLEGRLPRAVWYAFVLGLWGLFLWKLDSRVFVTAATSSILYAAGRSHRLYTWLAARPLQYLGRISYSIYLVHVPLCMLLLAVKVRIAPPSDLVSLAFLGVCYAASIAAAHVLYTWVEAPCLEWTKRLKR